MWRNCTKCRKQKTLTDFHKGCGPGGYNCWCKSCIKKAQYVWDKRKRVEKNKHFPDLKSKNARAWERRHPLKIRAYSELYRAFKTGKIKKKNTCEKCGSTPTQCHHSDYSKPLEFIELCKKCHTQAHIEVTEAKKITLSFRRLFQFG